MLNVANGPNGPPRIPKPKSSSELRAGATDEQVRLRLNKQLANDDNRLPMLNVANGPSGPPRIPEPKSSSDQRVAANCVNSYCFKGPPLRPTGSKGKRLRRNTK